MSLSVAAHHFEMAWKRDSDLEREPQPIGKGWTRFHRVQKGFGQVILRHECGVEVEGPECACRGAEGSWLSVAGPMFETSPEQRRLMEWIQGVKSTFTFYGRGERMGQEIPFEPEQPYRLEYHPAYPKTVRRLALVGVRPEEW